MPATFDLKRALAKKKLSIRQLSKRLGIAYHNAFRLVHLKDPKLSTLNKLASAIGCKVRDLLKE